MRRHEILQLITEGQTTKGIARRSRLMERLDRDDVPGSSLLRSVAE